MYVFRYNEQKALDWLQKKVLRLSTAIHDSPIFTTGGGCDSEKGDGDLHYAFGMISDYIEPTLALKLKTMMNISDRVEKRKSSSGKQPVAKKVKCEANEDYSKLPLQAIQEPPKKNLNRAQKSLQKVNKKGMKNISSFFKAKPAKT